MIHTFLGFELDERLFELRYQGQVVATQTRVFGIIAYLLRHRDRVVGKDELIREVWQANVASDTAISQVVMMARKALRDEGENQRIIKTVRGRGFRFIADVQTVDPSQRAVAEPAPAPPASPQIESVHPGLIGRAAELDVVRRAIVDLEQRRGRLMLLEGPPGIGKTTLASAIAREAAARNVDVRWGRAWEAGGAPPYWPFVQILRGMAQREGLPAMRRYMGHGTADIVGMMPEWANGEVPVPLDVGSAHARFRLFDSLARFLRNACQPAADGGKAARLLILEDLHAVDEGSIELLRFLSSELSDVPLLLVATLRDLELASNPTLAQLAETLDEQQRVRLAGLSGDEIADLVAHRIGQPPSPQVLRTLSELSGGNPLLLGEMCRQLGPAGLESFVEPSTLASLTLPERMASAVRKQVSELPRATADVLSVASALGREFSTPLLATICEISEGELLERLAPAVARGLVRPLGAAEQRTFSHALVHSAIYADLSSNDRLELHRRIAQTLEQQHSPMNPGRAPLFEIAHHYYQAAALGCRQQALDYARRAATRACDMMAFEVAAGLYDRAYGLAEAQGSDSATLHELSCNAGDAWYHAGQLASAIARFDRAAAAARSERAAERFAQAVLRSAYALRSGLFHNRARQQELLEALSMLPETDSEIRAYVLAASALGMRGEQRLEARNAATQAAVDMARRLGNDIALQRTLMAQQYALWGVAHPSRVLEIANELVELGRRSNNREQMLDALLCRVSHYAELGDAQGTWRALEDFTRETERRASPWHVYMLSAFAPIEAAARGDFASAEQLSVRALRQGLRVQDPLAATGHAVRCLLFQLDRGVRHLPPPEAGEDEPPDFVPEDYHPFWALSWVNRGRRTRAAQTMMRLLAHDWAHVVSDTLRRPLLAVAGQVCAALGDRERLEQIYANLLPAQGLHLILQVGVSLGPVAHHLGTVAEALGRYEEADTHYRQGLTGSEKGSPWHLRSQVGYGRVLHLRGIPRGRDLLLEADKVAEELGMRDLRDDIQQALARGGKATAQRT